MQHLTVYKRFASIIAVLTVVFVSALVAQVMVLRETVIEERRTKVFDMVEAAKKVLSNYEEKAKAGKISQADARQLALMRSVPCAGVNLPTISASMAPAARMPV